MLANHPSPCGLRSGGRRGRARRPTARAAAGCLYAALPRLREMLVEDFTPTAATDEQPA